MAEITLTNENFEEVVLKAELPVLVDFWAAWCGPCRQLGPTIAQISEEMEGKVIVGKVNVDEQADLAMKYSISSIPTIKIFKAGEVVATSVGVKAKADIIELIDK